MRPVSAQWTVEADGEMAASLSEKEAIVYICNDKNEVFRIITSNRLPMIGEGLYSYFPTTYRIDNGAERKAWLFLRSQDLETPEYTYTLIIDVSGKNTTIDAIISTLGAGNELTLDMWGSTIKSTFSLAGFQRAVSEVRRNCK